MSSIVNDHTTIRAILSSDVTRRIVSRNSDAHRSDVHVLDLSVPRVGLWSGRVGRQSHDKRRTFVGVALDRDIAAHQATETATDRKPQAGAAVASRCRAVGLGEFIEQRLQLIIGDADPRIRDPEGRGWRKLSYLIIAFHAAADVSRE